MKHNGEYYLQVIGEIIDMEANITKMFTVMPKGMRMHNSIKFSKILYDQVSIVREVNYCNDFNDWYILDSYDKKTWKIEHDEQLTLTDVMNTLKIIDDEYK
jgi:hypothetical protein